MPQVYPGILCAAPAEEGWFRALIKTVHESKSECDIMFVDYGGYVYNVPISTLRQIRYDFLSLPFQASECYLANVMPADGKLSSLLYCLTSQPEFLLLADNDWIPEANALFDELAQGLIYASIIGYAENGIPLVNLFKVQDSNVRTQTRLFTWLLHFIFVFSESSSIKNLSIADTDNGWPRKQLLLASNRFHNESIAICTLYSLLYIPSSFLLYTIFG